MRRVFGIVSLTLLTLLASQAQAQAIVSYTVAVFPGTATVTTGAPTNSLVYSASSVRCGQPLAADPGLVTNPTEGHFNDPVDGTKDCIVDVTPQVGGLALNTQFKGAIRANTSTTSTAYSPLSNAFVMQATTHPCDTTPVSKTSMLVGQAFELGWCHDGKDTNGNQTTVTGWKVYRNGVLVPAVVTTDPTPNATGLKYSHTSLSETAAGSASFQYSAVNSVGESAKGTALALTVTNPAMAPSMPTAGRIQ